MVSPGRLSPSRVRNHTLCHTWARRAGHSPGREGSLAGHCPRHARTPLQTPPPPSPRSACCTQRARVEARGRGRSVTAGTAGSGPRPAHVTWRPHCHTPPAPRREGFRHPGHIPGRPLGNPRGAGQSGLRSQARTCVGHLVPWSGQVQEPAVGRVATLGQFYSGAAVGYCFASHAGRTPPTCARCEEPHPPSHRVSARGPAPEGVSIPGARRRLRSDPGPTLRRRRTPGRADPPVWKAPTDVAIQGATTSVDGSPSSWTPGAGKGSAP